MPVKILLADKSITIQKVVEMLFSGKEYEVLCVSDGETALSEATRVVPDVVLADIDLPRVDGYTFSGRMKQQPALAKTPVILMMSRDDVFDEAKAKQAAIFDHIAKPFESQELIGKVKKAVSAAPPRLAEPSSAARPAPPKPQPAAATAVPAAAAKPKPKQAPPPDIFDIIQQAPTQADLKGSPAGQEADEGIFEVEPVVEVEEAAAPDASRALPVGKKAVEEMREGLGLAGKGQPDQDIVSFESLDMAVKNEQQFMPGGREEPRPPQKPVRAPEREAREYVPPPRETGVPAEGVPEERLRKIAEEIVARVAREQFGTSRPSAGISEDSVARTVKEIARDVIEKVAWEVVPDLAEMLIRQEIERLKAEP